MSTTPRIFRVLLLVLVLPVSSMAWPQQQGYGTGTDDRVAVFMAHVTEFQELAIDDYRVALSRYGNDVARGRFVDLDELLWSEVPATIGWGYFFNVSVSVFAGVGGERPLVGFYNPWSDLFLVTAWELDEESPSLVDAGILMGDVVRRGGEPPFGYTPLWVRPKLFRPAAVGLAVVDSVTAFEELFPGTGIRDWRSRLPHVAEAGSHYRENLEGARLLLLQHLNNIAQLVSPQAGEDPSLTTLRSLAEITVTLGAKGRIEEVLAVAGETTPPVRQALRYLASDAYGKLKPVGYYLGRDGGYVFLAPQANPGTFFSVMAEWQEDEVGEIGRIDVVHYAGLYEAVVDEEAGRERDRDR